MNYYELLGVDIYASYDEIRKSYLALAKNYHPDLNRAHNANYLFNEIKNAYETLSNPVLREEYNLKIGVLRNESVQNSEYDTYEEEVEQAPQMAKVEEKNETKSPLLFLLVAVVVVIILVLGLNSSKSEKAINIVKEYYGEYSSPEVWVLDDDKVHTIYGWTSKNVSGTTYYVAYEFDDDNNKSNGYRMYCFEVEMSSAVVRSIIGDTVLEKKYRDLGFID